jgi:hypothetical protein
VSDTDCFFRIPAPIQQTAREVQIDLYLIPAPIQQTARGYWSSYTRSQAAQYSEQASDTDCFIPDTSSDTKNCQEDTDQFIPDTSSNTINCQGILVILDQFPGSSDIVNRCQILIVFSGYQLQYNKLPGRY